MLDLEIILGGGLFSPQAEAEVERAAQQGATEAVAAAAEVARTTTAFKDGSGDLRRSISGKVEGKFLDDTMELVVKADADNAEFVNNGTRPHTIRPRRGKALQLRSLGDDVFSKKVNHPGTEATHFLENSLDVPRTQAILADKIEKALGG